MMLSMYDVYRKLRVSLYVRFPVCPFQDSMLALLVIPAKKFVVVLYPDMALDFKGYSDINSTVCLEHGILYMWFNCTA